MDLTPEVEPVFRRVAEFRVFGLEKAKHKDEDVLPVHVIAEKVSVPTQ